jgi:hypothetical protein
VTPVLTADLRYVFDMPADCSVRTYPPGLVAFEKKKGPRDITARFYGGLGAEEDRTFAGPCVWVGRAVGVGEVTVVVTPLGLKSDADIRTDTFRVDAGLVPQPPPDPPKPPEPPKPEPPPPKPISPIDADGLHVLILFDPKQALPAKQVSILDGARTRKFLEDNCAAGPRNKQYRIWPVVTDGYTDSKLWGDAATRPRTSLPWVVIGNRLKGGFEGPLPADEDAFIALASKYR